jgi:hypothetical protein
MLQQMITKVVNDARHSPLLHNGVACKDKWDVIYGDFKRLFDYMFKTCNNIF